MSETKPAKPMREMKRCPLCRSQLSVRTADGTAFLECLVCKFVAFRNVNQEGTRSIINKLWPINPTRQPMTEQTEKEIYTLTDEMERDIPSYELHFGNDYLARAYQLLCDTLRQL